MLLCVHQLAAGRHDGVLFWDGAHAMSEKKNRLADDEPATGGAKIFSAQVPRSRREQLERA